MDDILCCAVARGDFYHSMYNGQTGGIMVPD